MRKLFRQMINTGQLKCHRLQKCYKVNNTFHEYIQFQLGTKGTKIQDQSKCLSEMQGCEDKFKETEYIPVLFTTNVNPRGLNVPKYVLLNFYLS